MTFEQWLSEWLNSELSREVKTVLTVGNISSMITDGSDVDPWTRRTSFAIDFISKSKLEAATVSFSVQKIIDSLKHENFIIKSVIDAEIGERENAPANWRYGIVLTVTYRKRSSW